MESDFQDRMNDDLDVKGAFDKVYETVEALAKVAAADKLSKKDRKEAVGVLDRIDGVLQVMK